LLHGAQVDWDKERFDNIVQSLSTFLHGAGFRPKNLRFVPLSGMTGANLEKTGGVKECSWYSGPSLVEAIGASRPGRWLLSSPCLTCAL
jgi:elongation factor 1 alpha-like protein